jgi:hypothetical protein
VPEELLRISAFVDLPSMSHRGDEHKQLTVVDLIDREVATDANALLSSVTD